MHNKKIFTSESVTQGHPDKLCDLVSDSVLDAVLAQDPMGRVACETAATTGLVLVMGEISTSARIDIAQLARKAVCDAGYDRLEMGFDGHSCNVMVAMGRQSPDIAMGVDNAYDDGTTGAGDQGMMFGFACTQTKELMPAPIAYAHNLTRALTAARESGRLSWLRPDGKSQVSVEYGDDGMPARIDTVVVSTQHAEDIAIDDLRQAIIETVIEPNLPSRLLDKDTKYYVNPTGRFVIGGPAGDSGLTGRKIIVDTYGGYADDEDVGRLRLCGEVQAAGGHRLCHGVLQTGFDDMDMAGVQRLDDRILDVEAADLIPCQRKGDGSGKADVAAAHDFNFFHAFRSFVWKHTKILYPIFYAFASSVCTISVFSHGRSRSARPKWP